MTINSRQLNTADNLRVFALLAGEAGIGKTSQIVTFPIAESKIVSVEDGTLSIAGSGYNCDEVDSYDDILTILTKPQYTKGIKYLMIDSLSEIYNMLKKELKDKFTASQNFAKFDEMNIKLFHLIRIARQRTDLNIYFTCHTKKEKVGMATMDNLAFDGKMPEDLKKQFDLVIEMVSKQFEGHPAPVRCFVTDPSLGVAKARVSPYLGITLTNYEEANLYKLTNKLLGKGA